MTVLAKNRFGVAWVLLMVLSCGQDPSFSKLDQEGSSAVVSESEEVKIVAVKPGNLIVRIKAGLKATVAGVAPLSEANLHGSKDVAQRKVPAGMLLLNCISYRKRGGMIFHSVSIADARYLMVSESSKIGAFLKLSHPKILLEGWESANGNFYYLSSISYDPKDTQALLPIENLGTTRLIGRAEKQANTLKKRGAIPLISEVVIAERVPSGKLSYIRVRN